MTSYALITGGASGMGLAVAKALSRRGGWSIHCLDLKGEEAVQQVPNATFHSVNVLDYEALAATFQSIFDTEKRLDFVFANAGIVERFNFYDSFPLGKPPPKPDQTVVDVNLKSVIDTSWLAQHYLGHSTASKNKNLVMTASAAGIYRCQGVPSYTGAKHGVVGVMRSIAPNYWKKSAIRVNAICPAAVRTGLVESAAWDQFPADLFSPVEKISEVVLMLIDGKDVGGKVPVEGKPLAGERNGVKDDGYHGSGDGLMWGKVVEISGLNHYYREQLPFSDDNVAKNIAVTDRDVF